METLILSSKGPILFDFSLDEYLPKKLINCKMAYITTAAKKCFDNSHIIAMKDKMNEVKLDYEEIDIAGMSEETLRNKLVKYDVIMVDGGNTYYLLKCIRESGFEKIIKELLARGVVYIGISSGAYVASPSIITATWSNRGFDTFGIIDYTAMNIVPFLIKVHYTPDKLEFFKEKRNGEKLPLCLLGDDQVIILNDNKMIFLGNKEPIILS